MMKFLYYLVLDILLLPFALILFLVKVVCKVRFVRIVDERIGHLAANTEVFLRRLELGRIESRSTYVGIASTAPANRQLLAMISRKMKVIAIPPWLHHNAFIKTLSYDRSLLSMLGVYNRLTFNSNEYDEFNTGRPMLSFTSAEKREGRALLRRIGVPEDGWFVCMSIRDAAYLTKHTGDDTYLSYRNSSISSYLAAARSVVAKGGHVVRLGSVVEERMPGEKGLIDYAHDFRTDFGDIYLSSHCRFYLGSTAGIVMLPALFHVPLAKADLIPLKFVSFRKGDIFIPKKIYSKRKRRNLSFREIVETGAMDYEFDDQYKAAGLVPVENSPEEILDLVQEMMGVLDGTFRYTAEDVQLQERFRSILEQHPHCAGYPAQAGALFLRKNKDLLE